jgi:hypothetical protein
MRALSRRPLQSPVTGDVHASHMARACILNGSMDVDKEQCGLSHIQVRTFED